MEDMANQIFGKITSYNIFNNLFPGITFCSALSRLTRFNITADSILEQLFVWYFVGVIISRIGSIFVEGLLKKIKVKGKPYLVFAEYKEYTEASKSNPFIETLSEANNTYRTIISLLICTGIVYLYDTLLYDMVVEYCAFLNYIVAIIVWIFLIILFIISYKKQTNYIKKQVEKHINEKNSQK